MVARRQIVISSYPRSLRRVAALCLVIAYLLTGALHAVCDLDVAHPRAGGSEIATLIDAADHAGKSAAIVHDCHGCFSVMTPQPPVTFVSLAPMVAPAWPYPTVRAGITPDTESPPPKFLS